MDRKPENGSEIQNAACGCSGVMLKLKLVKTTEEDSHNDDEDEEGILHETKVLKYLVKNYFWSDRIVCGDSYFASVGAAEELLKYNLQFIGVVKTATKKYPMEYLSKKELVERGDRWGVVAKQANNNQPKLLAFVWVDRDRRYFISSCSSLEEGRPYTRHGWRQIEQDLFSPPERLELTIPQPKACETYYDTCSAIDRHNRHRQDTLQIERKIRTMDWSKRVNMTILSMIIVDSWLVWSKITVDKNDNPIETQKQFYSELATELIDNSFDSVGSGRRRSQYINSHTNDGIDLVTQQPRSGTAIHLTPTKRKRRKADGSFTDWAYRGNCKVCRKKTRYQCSKCKDDATPDTNHSCGWMCHVSYSKWSNVLCNTCF